MGRNNIYNNKRKHPAPDLSSLTPSNKRPAFDKIPHEPHESKLRCSDLGGCDAQFLVIIFFIIL